MEKVITEISARGLPQHVPNLVAHDEKQYRRMEELFRRCEELALQHGVELHLPRLARATNGGATSSRRERVCHRLRDGAPCYFLWHSFTCHADGRIRPVDALSFGSVNETPLLDIWNGPEFSDYRSEIGRYDFPTAATAALRRATISSATISSRIAWGTPLPADRAHGASACFSVSGNLFLSRFTGLRPGRRTLRRAEPCEFSGARA